MWLCPIAYAWPLFAEVRIASRNSIRGFACERAFCFSNLAKKNTSEVARDFVAQTKVRALFHYIQGVLEFPYQGGIWPIVHLALIVPYAL